MGYYIDINEHDPQNDCRGIWSEDMLRQFAETAAVLDDLNQRLRHAQSTRDKLDIINKFKDVNTFDVLHVAETVAEELDKLTGK